MSFPWRLTRVPVGAALLLAGCASPDIVPPTVETAGMPNTELALRRAMDQVNSDMGNLGGLRPYTAVAAPVATVVTPGQPLALAPTTLATQPAPPARPPSPSAAVASAAPATTTPAPLPVLPADLDKRLAFTWNGPLDGAVSKLGAQIGYQVTISGPPASRPLKIVVDVSGTAVDVLRAVGNEAGTRATVSVDPLHHQISVLHHV
jgi:defect-in-organelle-trafficking protein DotD